MVFHHFCQFLGHSCIFKDFVIIQNGSPKCLLMLIDRNAAALAFLLVVVVDISTNYIFRIFLF